MKNKQVREEIKNVIIAQGGQIYNFNLNNLHEAYGFTYGEMQNAMNYFSYSPQQAKFREQYNYK